MPQSGRITERALVYLTPDVKGPDVFDASTKAGKIFKNLLATISSQPGFVSGHWGFRHGVENIAEHIVGIEKCPLGFLCHPGLHIPLNFLRLLRLGMPCRTRCFE